MTDTPTKELMIQGETFTLAIPYVEGHVLSAIEAKVLSQTWFENVRNNQAKAIKEAKENGGFDLAAATTTVLAYADAYAFSVGGTGAGRQSLDPIEKEARAIARGMIAAQMKTEGRKMKDLNKDKLANAIAKWAEHPEVIKSAKQVVKERAKLANLSLEDVGD